MTCRLLCLTFLVLGFGVVHAQERKQPTTHSRQLTQNLLEIMEKTESVDTFVVSLKLLLENKPFNRAEVIPAVILNAERLGIFADNFRKGENDRTELFREMAEVLDELNKKPEKKVTRHVESNNGVTFEPFTPEEIRAYHKYYKNLKKKVMVCNTATPTAPMPGLPIMSPPQCTWKCTVHYLNSLVFPLGLHIDWPQTRVLYINQEVPPR